MLKRYGFALALMTVAAPAFAAPALAADGAWTPATDTAGIATKEGKGFTAALWNGASQADAQALIKAMPDRFGDAAYYTIFRDLLTADAAPFESGKKSQEVPATTGAPYDFINLRLNTLYRIGAFDEAASLYQAVFPAVPDDERIALHSLNISLAKGRLAAACLDVQALEAKFESRDFWQDFNQICDYYYNEDAIKAAPAGEDAPKSEPVGMAPVVDDAADDSAAVDETVRPAPSAIAANLKFRLFTGFSTIINRQVTPQALAQMNLTEKLMAHAARAVPFKAVLDSYKGDPALIPSDILHILALQDDPAPERACLTQEAFKRGMIGASGMALALRGLEFPENDLESDTIKVGIHPCRKAGWVFQWIEKALDDTDKARRTLSAFREIAVNAPDMMDAFAPFFATLDPDQLGADALPLAASLRRVNGKLPPQWLQKATTNQSDDADSALAEKPAAYWPFLVMEKPEIFTPNSYAAWVSGWSSNLPLLKQNDPARLLSLLKNILVLEKYEAALKLCYEKFFSLTFYRNYVISSYSLTGRAITANQNDRFGEAILLYLHVMGHQKVSNTYPEYLSEMVGLLAKAGHHDAEKNIIGSTYSVGKD